MSQVESKKEWDLRSDTVTKPTPSMRKAMAEAPVGDDVWGDDPTVKELQDLTCSLLQKPAALYVPSGTMANLLAVLVHCDQRDSEMIVGDKAHIHIYEQGSSATLGGVHSRALSNLDDGTIPIEKIQAAIRSRDDHFPVTKLICLENTHNMCGGKVLSLEYSKQVCDLAHSRGIKVHLDGARMANAAAYLGCTIADIAAPFDSINLCLSKGLGAPIGSLIVGTEEFIGRCRRLRKALGGGMRQAGIVAAAGIVSLREMLPRIGEDHVVAKELANQLSNVPGIQVDPSRVVTNMIYVTVDRNIVSDHSVFESKLKERNVIVASREPFSYRLVTHHHVALSDVPQVVEAFRYATSK